jgi:hypothetical protein
MPASYITPAPVSHTSLCVQARSERESALGSLSRAADARRAAEARELSEARAELQRARADRDAAEARAAQAEEEMARQAVALASARYVVCDVIWLQFTR